jgi:hypothetical protein
MFLQVEMNKYCSDVPNAAKEPEVSSSLFGSLFQDGSWKNRNYNQDFYLSVLCSILHQGLKSHVKITDFSH